MGSARRSTGADGVANNMAAVCVSGGCGSDEGVELDGQGKRMMMLDGPVLLIDGGPVLVCWGEPA
jgi:hypothetical protein